MSELARVSAASPRLSLLSNGDRTQHGHEFIFTDWHSPGKGFPPMTVPSTLMSFNSSGDVNFERIAVKGSPRGSARFACYPPSANWPK